MNSSPALRQVSVAEGKCLPIAHASIRFGAALLRAEAKDKSVGEMVAEISKPGHEPLP